MISFDIFRLNIIKFISIILIFIFLYRWSNTMLIDFCMKTYASAVKIAMSSIIGYIAVIILIINVVYFVHIFLLMYVVSIY